MADPVSIAGSGVGVISLGLTVFSGLLQYYGDWKDSEKDIAATYTSIEGLTKTFMLIKDTIDGQSFRSDIVDRVTESLDSCSAGVQSLEKKLAKIRRTTPDKPGEKLRAHARKAAYPFKKSTLIKLAEVVSDLRDNVSLAVDTLQLDMSASSLQKLEDISARLATHVQQSQSASADIARDIAEVRLTQKENDSRLLDQETLQIVRWLSPLNFSFRQNDVSFRRQQGAGNWLLQSEQFRMWLDGRINILWCPGMPGAGKTVLASVIVDYLKQSTQHGGVGIGYVYCIYNAVDQTATNLMASLLQQLVRQQSVLSEDVTNLYNQHRRDETRPSLPEYIRLLQAQIQRFSRVFIVVDALDECSEDDGVRDLFLAKLRYLLPHISLLVTSRHIASLDRAFEDATRLEIRANDEDLRTYLQVRIEDEALMKSLIKEDCKLKDTIISGIIDKANGMFLLAKLHLNSLLNLDNRRSLRRALHSLPKELDKTYDDTMLRIDSQERQKVERAGQVLSWISYAERPLTVRELQCALAIELEDAEFDEEAVPNENALLSVCCGLVVVEQESNIVRFVHFTTEKYIEQIRQTRYTSAQKVLSEACLTYLSLNVFASGPCPEEIASSRLEVYPFLEYAVQHWGDHARKALEQGLNIEDSILEFLRARGSVGSFVEVEGILDSGAYTEGEGCPELYEYYTEFSDLHIAARFGLDKLVRKLIDRGTDVNVRDYAGRTPLHRAVAKGHDTTVRLLLEQGANIRAKDRDALNALELAASETVVQTLFEHALEVHNPPFDEFDPYCGFYCVAENAAEKGHVKVIQSLFKRWNHNERSVNTIYGMLSAAAMSGQERVVGLLLEEARWLESFDVSKSQALGYAARKNHTSIMGLLLEAGADINTIGHRGETALHMAVAGGYMAVAGGCMAATQLLLDKGADLEVASYDGDKPLHKAAENGYDKMISLLLDKGAGVDAAARNGETALIRAAKNGLVHVVRQLLDRGADMIVKGQYCGRSALHWAIVEGRETVVEVLLEHETLEGPTDNIITLTRLYHAINVKDDNGVQELLSDKQMLQSKDIREFLSLHAAAMYGYESVVKAFLENGAEVDGKVEGSRTALTLAAPWGHTPAVKLLLEHGADIEWKDDCGGTALSMAAYFGITPVVELLLEHGADIESKGYAGQTALSLAAKEGHTPVVKLLLENGADIDCGGSNTTALVLAAGNGSMETVRLLLQAGANVNAQDLKHGRGTALHHAAGGRGSEENVKMLIESGADLEAQNSERETALVRAVKEGQVAKSQILLERGANPNAVEATVSPSPEEVYEVDFQTALKLVQEAQKTWKGTEPGSDTVEGHSPGNLMHILYRFRELDWRSSIASITWLPFPALRSHDYYSVFRPLAWANLHMAFIGLLLVSFLYLYVSLSL